MGREGVIEVTVHRGQDGPDRIQVAGTAVQAGRMDVAVNFADTGSGVCATWVRSQLPSL